MKNRKAKKGFTIIELVIVIAVIGILAAVLIPTFSGVIDKANASAAAQNAKVIYEEASVAAAMGGVSLDGVKIADENDKYVYTVDGGSLTGPVEGAPAGMTATDVKSNMKIYMAGGLNVVEGNDKKLSFNNGTAPITTGTSLVIRNIDGEAVKTVVLEENETTITVSGIELTNVESGWYSFTIKTNAANTTYTGVFYYAA